ncbi:hypothetical protein HN011_006533 [Eciton burchellii]|nr:hypothetical protein HN011_006532 [Eciton burchellii]KAH0946909.1 hypothetical protein HN011_006533 [Eciton burchellii]
MRRPTNEVSLITSIHLGAKRGAPEPDRKHRYVCINGSGDRFGDIIRVNEKREKTEKERIGGRLRSGDESECKVEISFSQITRKQMPRLSRPPLQVASINAEILKKRQSDQAIPRGISDFSISQQFAAIAERTGERTKDHR